MSERLAIREVGRDLTIPQDRGPDRNPVLVYLARLSPSSRRTMSQALDSVAAMLVGGRCPATVLDWSRLRYQHTAAIRARVVERCGLAASRTRLAALRGVLREAWRLGLTSAEDFQRAADLAPVQGTSPPSGRAIAAGEVLALVSACKADPSEAGRRDTAILAVLFSGGLRRAELVALDLEDLDAATGALVIRSGKGRKARMAYLAEGARRAVVDWLEVRGADPGPLFWPGRRGGSLAPARMSPDAVLKLVRRRARQANVVAFSPHDARRTFAGDLLDRGADVATVKALMGHASVETTVRYDRRGEAVKAKASALLHFPY